MSNHHQNPFHLQHTTIETVIKIIKSLRNDCSTGYDNIPVSFIKPVAEYIASPLTFIINNCIKTNTFPKQWKIAHISPIPKVKVPITTSDYRPISILPVLSKIFEKVVLHQVNSFIEDRIIYHQYQSGYHKKHSTLTVLIKMRNDINRAMKGSEITISVFAYYSKAFDTIDFDILIRKLHALNVSTTFLYWLLDLYERKHFVQINSNFSTFLYSSFGVPQALF